MSLRVWLPLDGDLRNQGISDLNTINMPSSATVDNTGKIGKCYTSSGAASGVSTNLSFSASQFSIAAWVRINTRVNAWRCPFKLINSTAGDYIGFCCEHNTQATYIGFHFYKTIDGTNTSIFDAYPITDMTVGVWTHLVVTYDGKVATYYKDGIKVSSTTVAVARQNTVANIDRIIMLGSDGGRGGAAVKSSLNDVRIYDHCLSAAEIKEIAQGLVLHYKLDASSEEKITTVLSTNVYSYPTFNTSTASGGWNHWGPSGHSGSYGQNTDKKYIYNKNNTYSHWITEDAGTGKYYLLYQSPAFEGGYRSLQAIIKEENGLPITESICYPDWNARNGGVPNYKWTTIKSLGDGFYYCCCEGISQDGSNDLIGIIVQPGYKIYVSECYLENNTETCSPIFTYSSNIVQDSSGYNNYATINSAIQLSSDTPRYTSASYFGVYNTPNAILSNASILPALNNCTITWWGKYDTTKTLLLTGQSTSHYIGASTNNNNYYHGNAGSPVMYKDGVSGTYKCAADGWHFFALTGVNISTWTTLKINGYGSGWPLNGYISDFRIYCTPLLDTDIKQLYNVGMKVDKEQNIHAFEFNETTGRTQFLKTGVIKSAQVVDNLLFDNKAHIGKRSYENILPNNVNIVTTKNGHITNQNILASIPAAKIQSFAGKTLRLTYDVKADGTRSSAENNQTAWNYIRYGIHGSFQYTNASGTTSTSYPFAGDLAYSGAAKRSTQTWTIPTGYQSYGALSFSIQTFDKPASTNNETWFIQNVRLEVIDNTIDGYITGTQLIEK